MHHTGALKRQNESVELGSGIIRACAKRTEIRTAPESFRATKKREMIGTILVFEFVGDLIVLALLVVVFMSTSVPALRKLPGIG